MNIENFLNKIRDKSIHIVGVSGAEGSSILRLLISHKIDNIKTHDFEDKNKLEKSFKLWHKGISVGERNKLFKRFLNDLSKTTFYSGKDYLRNILSADIIFVPQSWRLYKEQNQILYEAKKRNISFYSLTRLYLDFSRAKVIGVTGTVGKGSTANILVNALKIKYKNVYFAGNESWMVQLIDKISMMKKEDILVLEISHRQLQDGFTRAPNIAVFTNIYPNHLDEVSWNDYKRLKFSLALEQKENDITVLNYDFPELRSIVGKLKSKVFYYSIKNQKMNTKNIHKYYSLIMNSKNTHYKENILAAATVIDLLDIKIETFLETLKNIQALPARNQLVAKVSEIRFFNDIKSTTPWATLAAVRKLGKSCILICGGRTKGINYQHFVEKIKNEVKFIIFLKSELSDNLKKLIPHDSYKIFTDLRKAILFAYQKAEKGDNILISPAAGFFYSDFIQGKESIRKIVTSLPLKE
uniref:Uncharacterized protein n=1 Tax=candidate division CPR3 bacterium TaxID=2268181 RepID=A0A7C4M2L8_UNCC3